MENGVGDGLTRQPAGVTGQKKSTHRRRATYSLIVWRRARGGGGGGVVELAVEGTGRRSGARAAGRCTWPTTDTRRRPHGVGRHAILMRGQGAGVVCSKSRS